MKKKLALFLALSVLAFIVVLGSCSGPTDPTDTTTTTAATPTPPPPPPPPPITPKITVSNPPAGPNLNIAVYSSSTLPTTKAEFDAAKAVKAIATSTTTSGTNHTLTLLAGTTTIAGSRLVIIAPAGTSEMKFSLVSFDASCVGAADYSAMTNQNSLPNS